MSDYGKGNITGLAAMAQNQAGATIRNDKRPSEGAINYAVNDTSTLLDKLDAAIGDLASALNPVLSHEPPEVPHTAGAKEQSQSALHDILLSLNSRIMDARNRINQLTNRITL